MELPYLKQNCELTLNEGLELHYGVNPTFKENVKNIFITGNTVFDACKHFNYKICYNNQILITLHRREHFGEKLMSLF